MRVQEEAVPPRGVGFEAWRRRHWTVLKAQVEAQVGPLICKLTQREISKAAVLGDANEVLKAIHKLKRRAYLCAASAPAVAGGVRA